MNDVLDFVIGQVYYDPRPFGAAGNLPNQAGQSAAAQENDCTLLKWYVTKLWQPDTGTASDGSGGSKDKAGPHSEISGSQSSNPGDILSAGSKRVVENDQGNIMMLYVTERTRFVTAVTAAR